VPANGPGPGRANDAAASRCQTAAMAYLRRFGVFIVLTRRPTLRARHHSPRRDRWAPKFIIMYGEERRRGACRGPRQTLGHSRGDPHVTQFRRCLRRSVRPLTCAPNGECPDSVGCALFGIRFSCPLVRFRPARAPGRVRPGLYRRPISTGAVEMITIPRAEFEAMQAELRRLRLIVARGWGPAPAQRRP
jgi:hypothetical protein